MKKNKRKAKRQRKLIFATAVLFLGTCFMTGNYATLAGTINVQTKKGNIVQNMTGV